MNSTWSNNSRFKNNNNNYNNEQEDYDDIYINKLRERKEKFSRTTKAD